MDLSATIAQKSKKISMNKINFKKSSKYYRNLWILTTFLVVILFGAVLNLNAIINNDNRMPVWDNYDSWCHNSSTHFCFTDKNNVNMFYLSDIFHIDFFYFEMYFSIGDILIFTLFPELIFAIVFLLDAFQDIKNSIFQENRKNKKWKRKERKKYPYRNRKK